MVFMGRLNLMTLLKFLGGIILVQAVTAIVVFAGRDLSAPADWWLMAAALATAVFAAFWFAAIAAHSSRDAVSRARESFSREREKIRVRAEKEKTKIIEQSHRQMSRQASQVQAKANFKVGAALAGAVAVGGVMMLTQFFSLGLVLLSGSGGALAGYLARMRQEARSATAALPGRTAAGALETDVTPPLPKSRKPSFGTSRD